MIYQLKRAMRGIAWAGTLRDAYWTSALLAHDVPLMPAHCDGMGDLFLGKPAVHISRDLRADFLLRHLGKVRDLIAAGGTVRYADDSAVFSFSGVQFEITTDQTLSIVHEVFYERTYGVRPPYAAVVVDIGMNVGVASLFFAMQGYPVYAFEPFAQTYALAQRNFALNPHIAGRITHRQIGLGETAGEFTALYCPQSPGDCGLTPIPGQYRAGRETRQEAIRIEAASVVLSDIARLHPDRRLIVKMDCEGSEVGIMQSLHKAGTVRSIDAFLIEWHRRASAALPQSLEELLAEEGFVVFSRGWPGREVGMICAVRT